MGIFGKLFKKTEINKCEICGEIIHSDIIGPCLSCKEKVGTKADHEGEYKDDQQVGLRKVYYENGQLEFEGEYKDGKKVGLWKMYYENGQLKNEVRFKDDQKEGLCKSYLENGQLFGEGEYKDGKKVGLWKVYYENGQLLSEGKYKDDQQVGLWKEYRENGQLIEEFNNEVNSKAALQEEDQKSFSNTSSDKSKTKEVIEYHDNGKLLKKGILDIDEKPHGNFKFWFPSGNIQMDGNFIHGVNHGSYKEYFENGNLHKEFNYKNGEQHGKNNEYYEDGSKNIISKYKEGKLHGLREQYYPSNSLEMRTTFSEGIKEGVHTYLDEHGEIIEQKVMKDGRDIMPELIKLVYDGGHIMQSLFTAESEKVEKWTMAQRMYDYVKNNNLNVESSEVSALNELLEEGKITKEFYDVTLDILKKNNQ